MKNKFALLTLAAALSATASASSIIYGAGSNGDLYTINPTNGSTTLVGSFGNGVTMFDIAAYDGALYGIDGNSDLYSINTSTGQATEIGSTGEAFNALTFSSTGILYAAGLDTSDLYTINTTTGKATEVAGETNKTNYNAAGDLEFINGVLYMTVGGAGPDDPSTLVTVNLSTGAMTTVGEIKVGKTPVDDVFGLAEYDGTLYGFTSNGTGEVVSINTSTGAAENVASYGGSECGGFTFYGATDDPYVDPPAAPEPATLGAMGLGLLSLGGLVYRRRKE